MLKVYVPIYNSVFCAEYQIKTLRTFLLDDFELTVIDQNMGRHPEASKAVEELCTREGVQFVTNTDPACAEFQDEIEKGTLGASGKLGQTLNMIWQNVARDSRIKYFGFLDQDCFLFQPTSVIEMLQSRPAYGKVVPTHPERPRHWLPDGRVLKWNLHVIANFYDTEWLKQKQAVNFMPGYLAEMYISGPQGRLLRNELDTGGLNWPTIWRLEDPKSYALVEDHYHYFEDQSLLDPTGLAPTKTLFEVLDNRWVHMVHGAIDEDSSEYLHPKTAYMKGFLDSAMMAHGSGEVKPTAFRSVWDPRGSADVT